MKGNVKLIVFFFFNFQNNNSKLIARAEKSFRTRNVSSTRNRTKKKKNSNKYGISYCSTLNVRGRRDEMTYLTQFFFARNLQLKLFVGRRLRKLCDNRYSMFNCYAGINVKILYVSFFSSPLILFVS